MALTFAAYAVPGSGGAAALLAALAVGRVDGGEPARDHADGRLARILVALSILALVVFVVAIVVERQGVERRLRRPRLASSTAASTACSSPPGCSSSRSPATHGSRRSARRCATRSARSLARSRSRSGSWSCLYLVVGVAALAAAGAERLAASSAPLATAVNAVGAGWAQPVVRVGAAVASLGALLALIAGVGRTALAMARNGDLPRPLASVDARRRSRPRRARGRRCRCRARARDRPARRDRLLLVRRAPLLRRCERLGLHPGSGAPPLAARAERRRRVGCVVLVASLPGSSIVAGVIVSRSGSPDGPSSERGEKRE